MNGCWCLAQNAKLLLKHWSFLYYEQPKVMHNAVEKQGVAGSHTSIIKLDSMDTKNWSLKWSLMRFGWAQVASSGECVWFSSCILCIFIGYRIRMTLGYIWGFNCPGGGKKNNNLIQVIQLLSWWAQRVALCKSFICRANMNLMTPLFSSKIA